VTRNLENEKEQRFNSSYTSSANNDALMESLARRCYSNKYVNACFIFHIFRLRQKRYSKRPGDRVRV